MIIKLELKNGNNSQKTEIKLRKDMLIMVKMPKMKKHKLYVTKESTNVISYK